MKRVVSLEFWEDGNFGGTGCSLSLVRYFLKILVGHDSILVLICTQFFLVTLSITGSSIKV